MLALAGILLIGASAGQTPTWTEQNSIPRWARDVLRSQEFFSTYDVSTRLNPFLLQGDFDGDHRLDLAVLITRTKTREDGIAIIHAASSRPIVIGAGLAFGAGGEDFSWMNAWHTYSRQPVEQGASDEPPPGLVGDALVVHKLEAASALIYWDGESYRWYQQGD